MASSEERRQVAERLRVYSHDFNFGDNPHPFWYVMKAVFADCKPHSYYEIFARLADLIDPTCEMEDAGDVPASVKDNLSTFFCSECGSPIYNDMSPSYCPYCGARVVDGGDA